MGRVGERANAAELAKLADSRFLKSFANELGKSDVCIGGDSSSAPSEADAQAVWQAFARAMENTVAKMGRVTLPGFGSFYAQRHKGHAVQFGGKRIGDYAVFKFTASTMLNKRLREKDAKGKVTFGS